MLNMIFKLRNVTILKKIRNSDRWIIKRIKQFVQKVSEREWCEQRRSYGSLNDEDIIYIIRRKGTVVGLFSYIFTALARIRESTEKGWIPVVDMKNYPNAYLEDDQLGKENVWEFYFEQPGMVSLDEAYKSKHVILSDGEIAQSRPKASMDLLAEGSAELEIWRRVARKYLILNHRTALFIEREHCRLFSGKERVLGLIIRGTDYTFLKPEGHPIQPDIGELVTKAGEVIREYAISQCFLATEDRDYFDQIREQIEVRYGIPVVSNDKKWVQYNGGYLSQANSHKIRENDKYLSGLEYLTTVYILSKCNCIVGGRPGGATAAMILSEGFEYAYFFDKGVY